MQLKKNDPKIKEALGKAENAAISIKSIKESIVKVENKYERPENFNLILGCYEQTSTFRWSQSTSYQNISGNWFDTFGANGWYASE